MAGVTHFMLRWNEGMDRMEARFKHEAGGARNKLRLIARIADLMEETEESHYPIAVSVGDVLMRRDARVYITDLHCLDVLNAIKEDEACAPALRRGSLKIALGKTASAKIEEARAFNAKFDAELLSLAAE